MLESVPDISLFDIPYPSGHASFHPQVITKLPSLIDGVISSCYILTDGVGIIIFNQGHLRDARQHQASCRSVTGFPEGAPQRSHQPPDERE